MENLKKGIKRGIPIAFGYIPIGIAFGMMANTAGLPVYIIIMMSFCVYAGASQFMAVGLINQGISSIEIIMTTFIVNSRHFLMSSSLTQKFFKNIDQKHYKFLAFGITDETFAVHSMTKNEDLDKEKVYGVNLIAYLSWGLSTIIGILMGKVLPDIIQSSMGISLYAMFIALLIPNIKNNKEIKLIVYITILISMIFNYTPYLKNVFQSGVKILVIVIISSIIGAVFFKEAVDKLE
ncbi:MAG: AzlC family ABC transporter permease [Bacillota bacterium]